MQDIQDIFSQGSGEKDSQQIYINLECESQIQDNQLYSDQNNIQDLQDNECRDQFYNVKSQLLYQQSLTNIKQIANTQNEMQFIMNHETAKYMKNELPSGYQLMLAPKKLQRQVSSNKKIQLKQNFLDSESTATASTKMNSIQSLSQTASTVLAFKQSGPKIKQPTQSNKIIQLFDKNLKVKSAPQYQTQQLQQIQINQPSKSAQQHSVIAKIQEPINISQMKQTSQSNSNKICLKIPSLYQSTQLVPQEGNLSDSVSQTSRNCIILPEKFFAKNQLKSKEEESKKAIRPSKPSKVQKNNEQEYELKSDKKIEIRNINYINLNIPMKLSNLESSNIINNQYQQNLENTQQTLTSIANFTSTSNIIQLNLGGQGGTRLNEQEPLKKIKLNSQGLCIRKIQSSNTMMNAEQQELSEMSQSMKSENADNLNEQFSGKLKLKERKIKIKAMDKFSSRFNIQKIQAQKHAYTYQSIKSSDSMQLKHRFVKMLKPEFKNLYHRVLQRLQKHQPDCKYFLQPVDAIALNIPDYLTIITKPMDLSTVEEKLLNLKYSNRQEFEQDLDLIWQNAIDYNPSQHYVHQSAKNMREYTKTLLKNVEQQDVQVGNASDTSMLEWDKIMSQNKTDMPSQQYTPTKIVNLGRGLKGERDIDFESKLNQMSNTLSQIEERYLVTHEGKPTLHERLTEYLVTSNNVNVQAALNAPANRKAILLQEKRNLANSMKRLSAYHQLELLFILKVKNLVPETYDPKTRFEFNLNTMPDDVFRIVQYYVRAQMLVLNKQSQRRSKNKKGQQKAWDSLTNENANNTSIRQSSQISKMDQANINDLMLAEPSLLDASSEIINMNMLGEEDNIINNQIDQEALSNTLIQKIEVKNEEVIQKLEEAIKIEEKITPASKNKEVEVDSDDDISHEDTLSSDSGSLLSEPDRHLNFDDGVTEDFTRPLWIKSF